MKSHIQEKFSKEKFTFQSPTNKIEKSNIKPLISKLKLLPHYTSEAMKK